MSTPAVTPQPTSTLGQATAMTEGTQTPDVTASTEGIQPATPAAAPAPARGGSRLAAIISAVAHVADTALAGIPQGRRPDFVSGLGSGARAEQADIANQQAIKFRNFDDQVRLAQLHAQDQKMQLDTQEQQDAHNRAEIANRALANQYGIDYDTIANHGQVVMDHLAAQTAANGAASVPAGTHVSSDGQTIYMPKSPSPQQTQEGMKQMYTTLAPALGLPTLQPGQDFPSEKQINMLTNVQNGFGFDGTPIAHQNLPAYIAAAQNKRTQLAANGGTPQQLQAIDNVLGIYKANLKALDDHDAQVQQQKTQHDLALEKQKSQDKIAQQDNAAANKPAPKPQLVLALNPNGGSDVMNADEAAQQGLKQTTPLKSGDVQKLNGTIAGFNDVQTKTNQLADIVNSPEYAQVQAPLAQAMIEKGLTLDTHGISVPFGRINAAMNSEISKGANPATRKFVVAWLGTHEAVTQLPRLQTFGTSNRMTQTQMENAQQMLPQAGDTAELAQQKLNAFQDVLDPLRSRVPRMTGAGLTPSFREKQQQAAPMGSNLGKAVMANPNAYINSMK